MRRYKGLAAGAAVLTLGIVFLAAGRAADDKGPREDVDKLAALAGKDPAELHKKAEAYAKDLDSLEDVMNLMKKRMKNGDGGVGVGPKPTGKPDDGIEARIQNWGKKAPTKDDLAKDKDALVQMTDRVQAIGEIALAKPPKAAPGKAPADWKDYSQEMVKQSAELRKAIEAGDTKALKEVANKLNASCTNCHGKFRD